MKTKMDFKIMKIYKVPCKMVLESNKKKFKIDFWTLKKQRGIWSQLNFFYENLQGIMQKDHSNATKKSFNLISEH